MNAATPTNAAPETASPSPSAGELASMLVYLLNQYDRAVDVHAQVVMDTDADRELHARAVQTLRAAADPVRELLAATPADGASVAGPLGASAGALTCTCPKPRGAQLDRTLCGCGDMHFHCDDCGLRTDFCALDRRRP